MKELKVITYTDKIAVVSNEEAKDNNEVFITDTNHIYTRCNINKHFEGKKLIAHYPKIEGVAGVVIEEKENNQIEREVIKLIGLPEYVKIESLSPFTKSALELGIQCYKQAKANTFTKEDIEMAFASGQLNQMHNQKYWSGSKEYLQSIRKEYEVVMESDKCKYEDDLGTCDICQLNGNQYLCKNEQPKLTENGEFIIREI